MCLILWNLKQNQYQTILRKSQIISKGLTFHSPVHLMSFISFVEKHDEETPKTKLHSLGMFDNCLNFYFMFFASLQLYKFSLGYIVTIFNYLNKNVPQRLWKTWTHRWHSEKKKKIIIIMFVEYLYPFSTDGKLHHPPYGVAI